MVGKERCDIVDIGANGYIARILAVVGGNVVRWYCRESYTRHDEGSDGKRVRSEG